MTRANGNTSLWTLAKEGELRWRWNVLNQSVSTIANAMSLTRNAVIGKAHRMHLSKRPSPIKSRPRAAPGKACEWIEGDVGTPACGKPVVRGWWQPYCREHAIRSTADIAKPIARRKLRKEAA